MPAEIDHGDLPNTRRRTVLTELGRAGIVAIFRTPSPDGVLEACRVLCRSGVRAVEITLTIPDALPLLASIVDEFDGEVVVGAGTVMDATTCRRAIDAGASFIVSPVADGSVIDMCAANDVIAGALTPTEVLSARSLGADVVKLP
jgi:2-dehydro-3-deoxyphosphogluconate aldolase / (4S)-4-hydroxy-2-oxoglutarate aldolase